MKRRASRRLQAMASRPADRRCAQGQCSKARAPIRAARAALSGRRDAAAAPRGADNSGFGLRISSYPIPLKTAKNR
jgi:hypothetical protein